MCLEEKSYLLGGGGAYLIGLLVCYWTVKRVYISMNVQKLVVVVRTGRGVIWVEKRWARFFQYFRKRVSLTFGNPATFN